MSAPEKSEPQFVGNGLCQFALHGFVLTPQSETSINQTVEKLLARHELAFRFRRSPDFRLKMRVYDRFEDFTNSSAMRGLTNLQGVYVPRTKEIVTFRHEIPGFLGATLLHEASHAIMDEHFRRIQPWLSEGAAEYFAYVLARNPATTNLLQQRSALLNLWLREDKLPSLLQLLNADHEQWQAIDQEQAYSASWSVVQFLMSTETNRRLMNTLLMEWQQERRRSIDCARQIDELYPKGLKAFEIAWHRWIDPTGTAGYYKTAFRGSGLCQFAVHGYNLAPALEASINQQVQSLLEKQRAFFNWEPDPAFHPRIRLFGDVTNYARFSINSRMMGAATKAEDLARIEGYYTPLSKEIVTVTIVSDSSQDLADRVLRLANTAILEEHFRNVPRWVILGSPHFFITPGQSGGDHRLALTNAWKRMGLASAKLPSLTSLLDGRQSRDLDSNHETEVICWGLFEFLASSDPSRQVLNAMLRDPPSGSGTARLEGHYRGGVARLGIDFKQWLDKTMGKSVEE